MVFSPGTRASSGADDGPDEEEGTSGQEETPRPLFMVSSSKHERRLLSHRIIVFTFDPSSSFIDLFCVQVKV